MNRFDVIVVGGGLVGAAFAIALGDADVTVALIEPQPPRATPDPLSWDARVYTISPGNAEWLDRLGVWGRLPADRVSRIETMLVYGDQGSCLEFDAYDAGLRELAYVVEYSLLQHALWDALHSSPHVTLKTAGRCADALWDRNSVCLVLDDGTELTAQLVVGADGQDSWIRSRAGITPNVYDYGQLGVVANFAIQRAHDRTAFQWFRRDGVLALLPLPGDRVSMVWSAPEARARALLAATPQELCEEVMRASTGTLGALELLTGVAGFPLSRQHVDRLVEPRAALVGDAAHSVHPLAGQGVNLGLRDARELADVLTRRGAQRDCGDYGLLRRYERARKEDIMALELTTDGLEKLFKDPRVLFSRLRNVGLGLVNGLPLLKKAMIHRAVR